YRAALSLAAATFLDDNDVGLAFEQISDLIVRNPPQGSELGSSVMPFRVSRVFMVLRVGRDLILQFIILILATGYLDAFRGLKETRERLMCSKAKLQTAAFQIRSS